jgi:four helix bundle protein
MCAKCVEELFVYQKALDAADEISAILKRPCLDKDVRLRGQLGASSERVASLISEGFAQKTDRHFASYLYMSRGSSNEMRTQLHVAWKREYLTEEELKVLRDRYAEIARMLTGLIAHLNEENRKRRG